MKHRRVDSELIYATFACNPVGLVRTMINWLANPARFMRWSATALPWCGWLTVAAVVTGLYLALVTAPPDYQQG